MYGCHNISIALMLENNIYNVQSIYVGKSFFFSFFYFLSAQLFCTYHPFIKEFTSTADSTQ